MYTKPTGAKQVLVRYGYSDYDTYGNENYACAATGNLDAPHFIPQGSVRLHNTAVACPTPSIGHRDWETGCMAIGAAHDGPDAPCISPTQRARR